VRSICARLGSFTYHDVRNELKRMATPRADGRREYVGCHMPTERQLYQMLSRAEWCAEINPPSKHKAAEYEYRGDVPAAKEGVSCQSHG
jgi:hypothetical protein